MNAVSKVFALLLSICMLFACGGGLTKGKCNGRVRAIIFLWQRLMKKEQLIEVFSVAAYCGVLIVLTFLCFPFTSFFAYELQWRFVTAFFFSAGLTYLFMGLFSISKRTRLILTVLLPAVSLFLVGMIGIMQHSS